MNIVFIDHYSDIAEHQISGARDVLKAGHVITRCALIIQHVWGCPQMDNLLWHMCWPGSVCLASACGRDEMKWRGTDCSSDEIYSGILSLCDKAWESEWCITKYHTTGSFAVCHYIDFYHASHVKTRLHFAVSRMNKYSSSFMLLETTLCRWCLLWQHSQWLCGKWAWHVVKSALPRLLV